MSPVDEASSQFLRVPGVKRTQHLFGSVSVSGTTASVASGGSGGWDVSRTGVGTYVLSWSTPFANTAYGVSVSGMGNYAYLSYGTRYANSVTVICEFPAGTAIDRGFSFVASGLV